MSITPLDTPKGASDRNPISPLQTEAEGHLLREDTEKANAFLEAFFHPTLTMEREEAQETPATLHMAPIQDKEIEAIAMRMNS